MANHIFATCLLTLLHLTYISCGHGDHPSFWNGFKERFPRQKHFGNHEGNRPIHREGPWNFPHFPDFPHNFEENNWNRDDLPFNGGPSRGDHWNSRNNNNGPFSNVEESMGDGGRNNRGPVLFPVEPSSSTEQTTVSSRPVTNSINSFPNQRRPASQRRWPVRQRPSISSWDNSNPQSSVSSSTPAVPGMQTRMPPCEEACQTTPEYNPLCGSDNVTYNNMGRFNCAVSCGKNIRIEYRGACPVPVRG
ncbi:hypothetical protein WA026_005501 [Henosepilachna vigintioctopunctata]|uniref:Kazal-like domain-containing protein n=1 Tax=Henosepilachna vigintioctopunctata TaxID=420089 RepID=A0AAW1U463_9CUCU